MPTNPQDVREQLMASIHRIRFDDEDQYQVTDAMEMIAALNLQCIKCELVCRLLRTLLRRNIGTNEVENNIKRLHFYKYYC